MKPFLSRLKNTFCLKTLVPVISLMMIGGNILAQNAKAPVISVSQWKKQDDYMEERLPGKVHGEIKKIIDGLASWMQQGYMDAQGCTPAWSGAYFSNKSNTFPLFRYEMRAGFYSENAASAEPGKESRFTITVNDLSTLQQAFLLDGNSYGLLSPMKQLYNGVRYNETINAKDDTVPASRMTRNWLISYSDSLPYTFVSRKEYLQLAKKEISADKESLRQQMMQLMPVKSAEEEEATKKREIQEIENMYSGIMRANRTRMYLESYKPDSVYFKEAFTVKSAGFDADSLMLDSILVKSPADYLARPAYVSVPAASFRNFEDNIPGSRMLIKWDMNYFNKNISLARPQFFAVTWQYDTADSVAQAIDKQLMGKLELCDLAGLLGK